MKAYSPDLRERILHAVDQGTPRAEVAATFQVSLSTLKRYLKRRQVAGHLRRSPVPGRPSIAGAALDAGLAPQLAAHADATLEQHRHDEPRHCPVGLDTKKRRWQPPSATKQTARPGATSLRGSQQTA